jgi:glycine cleavage system aminomethyltransferase T
MKAGFNDGVVVTGPSDIRRIEACILDFGPDIFLATNPYEAGFDWMAEPEKEANFVEKDAFRRIKAQGVSKRLVGVELRCDLMP